jgi:hypothetical protein
MLSKEVLDEATDFVANLKNNETVINYFNEMIKNVKRVLSEDNLNEEILNAYMKFAINQFIAEKILENYKCQQCGKCCRIPAEHFLSEASRIANKINMPIDEFILKYCQKVKKFNTKTVSIYFRTPCPFLEDQSEDKSICKIHNFRPMVCRAFPLSSCNNVLYIQISEGCALAKQIESDFLKYFPDTCEAPSDVQQAVRIRGEERSKLGLKEASEKCRIIMGDTITFAAFLLKKRKSLNP